MLLLTFLRVENPGYSQRVFYYDHANFSPYLCAFSSLWIYRVQGETEGDFRRGDKRCVNQKSFNVRDRWKVRIDWVGADVLVVAPTGMGKVRVSYCVWTCSCCKDPILEHLLSSPCDCPSCSYTLFVVINEAHKLKNHSSLGSLLLSRHY
jgi:hypothetical protein